MSFIKKYFENGTRTRDCGSKLFGGLRLRVMMDEELKLLSVYTQPESSMIVSE